MHKLHMLNDQISYIKLTLIQRGVILIYLRYLKLSFTSEDLIYKKIMLTIVTLLIAAYWLLLSSFAFYHVRKVINLYKNVPHIQIKEEWKGFVRDDFGRWDERKIFIGCFTRFPYNLTVLGFLLISFVVLIPLSKYFGKRGKYIVSMFQRKYGNFAIRQAMNIVQQQDYQNYQIETPIIISNHINWFDVWFIGITFMPISIVSKASIKNTVIVGEITDFFDTIYVERKSENQRDSVVTKITQRIQKFNQNKHKINLLQRTYPLIIFPEGTTSNGKSILTFKMGAFNDLSPVTLFALNYKCKQFHMGMGDISQSQHVFINLCLKPTLQVKHKVMKPKSGESALQYCNRCRNQMSQMTGFPKVQSGYRDMLQYQKVLSQALKNKPKNSQKSL